MYTGYSTTQAFNKLILKKITMENQTKNSDSALTEQIIKQVIATWTGRNTVVTNFFNKHSDDNVYMSEVAPGRNRAVYLLGHLTATNDAMLPLLGFGEKLFPELEVMFSASPDKTVDEIPSVSELKEKWQKVNATLTEHFNKLTPAEWLERHTAVSEADFKLDPQRNRLNIILGRTNHQSYHFGQLNFLKVNELVA